MQDLVNTEKLVADAGAVFQLETGGGVQCFDSITIGDGGSPASAEDDRADREIKFVDQVCPEHGTIQFAAAFAKEASDLPFVAKPCEGCFQVQLGARGNEKIIRSFLECHEAVARSCFGREQDDGGEAFFENISTGTDRTRRAGDDAQVKFA